MSSQQNWPPSLPGASKGSDTFGSALRPPVSRNAVFQGLADDRRRAVLDVLLSATDTLTERELARALAAAETDGSTASIDADAVDTVQTTLRHSHLPALQEAQLVHWDRTSATVRAADHPAFQDDAIRQLVSTDDAADLFDALADERRRFVLAVLFTYGGSVEQSTVARKVADLETAERRSAGEPEDVRISLYHVHFPKLEAAGLVERDPENDEVRYVGHPDVDDSWFTF